MNVNDERDAGAGRGEGGAGEVAPPVGAARRRLREARRLLRAEVVYSAGLAVFAVLAVLANAYAYFSWDLWLARAIQSIDFPGWAGFMYWVSAFGNKATPWGLTCATVLLFLAWGRRSEGAGLALCAGGGTLINSIFKTVIGRPRPTADLVDFAYLDDDRSFPSGHVTFYVCYYGFLFFVAYALLPRASAARRVALACLALPVLLIGVSRVYLRAHWPSDVLGAYLSSGMWLVLSLEIYRRWKRRASLHPEETPVADQAHP